jgi:hypothetical protein
LLRVNLVGAVTPSLASVMPVSRCSPVKLLGPTSILAFCWRITRHNTLATLADIYPQWLVRDLLPLPSSGGIPREATRSLSPPSSADAAGQGCG